MICREPRGKDFNRNLHFDAAFFNLATTSVPTSFFDRCLVRFGSMFASFGEHVSIIFRYLFSTTFRHRCLIDFCSLGTLIVCFLSGRESHFHKMRCAMLFNLLVTFWKRFGGLLGLFWKSCCPMLAPRWTQDEPKSCQNRC